jgi:plastocyanin
MTTRRPRRLIAIAVTALALLGAACGDDDEGGASESFNIQAFDFRFDPTTLSVSPGAAVQLNFSNAGEVAHSVTIPDLDFEVVSESGEEASDTFTAPEEPGAIDFFCKFHPEEMNGTVSVAGGSEPIEEDVDSEDDDDADVDVDVEEEDDTSSGSTDIEY